jgi:hypothetical protein
MRPELHSISSSELSDGELPSEPTTAWVAVQVEMGPPGSGGADKFRIIVATPPALREGGSSRQGHWLLLVDSFDWSVVRAAVEKVLRHCEAEAAAL